MADIIPPEVMAGLKALADQGYTGPTPLQWNQGQIVGLDYTGRIRVTPKK